jgi:hypothetical protein
MPTARELLEQADALMRRNRERTAPPVDDDIPELTEEVNIEPYSPPAGRPPPVVDLRPPPADVDDIPELTDAVEEIEAPSILDLPDDDGEPSRWLEVDRGEVSITGPAPDSVVAVPATPRPVVRDPAPLAASPPMQVDELYPAEARFFVEPMPVDGPPESEAPAPVEAEIVVEILPAIEAPADAEPEAAVDAPDGFDVEPPDMPPADVPVEAFAAVEAAPADEPIAAPVAVSAEASAAPEVVSDAARWDALAEEIRMQVLQRIDIFTDTGLHDQLAARLQPIVDRASADLVATINQQVGQLLRAYVAEAIEREIEKWRQGGG